MSNAVEVLKNTLDAEGHAQNPMRPHVAERHEQELRRLSTIANAPPYVHANRGAAMKRYQDLKKVIEEQLPRAVKDPDQVARLADDVLENTIKPVMLTRAEMRRNPPGAVDRNIKGEASPVIKNAILQWKRAMLSLNWDNKTERDLVNLDKHRREGMSPETASHMVNAQIPGNFAFGATAKANWPAAMPEQGTVNSPLVQAQKRERKKREFTPEQRAEIGRRLVESRKNRQEAPPTAS